MLKSRFSLNALPFRKFVVSVLLVNILTIVAVILSLSFLPPEVPFFYGLAEGEGQLAKSIFLVLPSILSIVIILVNSSLSFFVDDDFFKKALVLAGVGTSFFAVITTLKIIFLVGSF